MEKLNLKIPASPHWRLTAEMADIHVNKVNNVGYDYFIIH